MLTPKQEQFCLYYHATGNASDAYKEAYDAQNMSKEAIKVEAYRLKQTPVVAARLEEMRLADRERNQVTIDTITAELEEARIVSIGIEQMSAAISAIMGKAKLHGLLVDKAKVEGNVVIQVSTGIERDGAAD